MQTNKQNTDEGRDSQLISSNHALIVQAALAKHYIHGQNIFSVRTRLCWLQKVVTLIASHRIPSWNAVQYIHKYNQIHTQNGMHAYSKLHCLALYTLNMHRTTVYCITWKLWVPGIMYIPLPHPHTHTKSTTCIGCIKYILFERQKNNCPFVHPTIHPYSNDSSIWFSIHSSIKPWKPSISYMCCMYLAWYALTTSNALQ